MKTSHSPAIAPALFVSHGAPTFALEPGLAGQQLQHLGKSLQEVQAVLIISPHWQTAEYTIMTNEQPETLYDFSGFPSALYQLEYPAPGSRFYALQVKDRLRTLGYTVHEDAQRGRDHGAWVPARYLFPTATTPIFQLSLPYHCTPAEAFELGQILAELRLQGLMILGSGGVTHNLREASPYAHEIPAYVIEFSQWVESAIQSRNIKALRNYRLEAPDAQRAHPTEEHFLPLLVTLGAAFPSDQILALRGEVTYGALAMDSYWFHSVLPQ